MRTSISIRLLSNAPRRSFFFGSRSCSRPSAAVTAAIFGLTTLATSAPSVARADNTASTVSPTGKGIVGGALLGAEVGTIIESIAGVHSPWIYLISDVVLGAGGAVGGWEVEQNSSDGRAPVFMLAGGLGLLIPAIVLTLNGTRYQPSENATEDHAPTNAPAANPGTPGGSIVTPSPGSSPAPAPATPPPSSGATPPGPTSSNPGRAGVPHLSLVAVGTDGMHLGLPVPEVRSTFSLSEQRQYGMAQQTEVRMPLVKIVF
jgi:hypothetical protein